MMKVTAVRRFATAGIAVAVVSGTAACSGGSGSTSPSPLTPSVDSRVANVTITATGGCAMDRSSFTSGGLTFKITNQDATAISEVELLGGERIVGEKENLPPGFSGTFSVNVPAGSYSLYCPGAAQEKTALTVTGTSATTAGTTSAALLSEGTKEYADYVNTQVGYLVQTSTVLAATLRGTDLAAAQAAYIKARPYYEKIEPVAESFTSGKNDLDAAIDARAGDVPASQWTGFHPIEKGLFQTKSLAGLASLGAGLVANVTTLQSLTAKLTYQPYELANGAQELLDEVASSKITGEEERYSHIDLLDFDGNNEGAEQAFADLQPGLAEMDPVLAGQISTQFAALNTLLSKYRSKTDPSGYVRYGALTAADKQAFAAAVKAVQEPLSRVAAKVAH